jgi:transcriptional regulator with XRE-family HTH domain
MIELKTPLNIISELIDIIEQTRISQELRQQDLANIADVSLPTYRKFIADKNISLQRLIKIMYALNMWDNLSGLLKKEEFKSIEDIRAKQTNTKPQRIKLKKDSK